MLIVGRAVAGLGSSGLMNGALTIIAVILPSHRQPLVMGINVGLDQIGIACGPPHRWSLHPVRLVALVYAFLSSSLLSPFHFCPLFLSNRMLAFYPNN